MSLRKAHFQTQANDFQTAENVLAQAEMEGLPPELFNICQNMVEKMGFERRDAAAKKENKQYVMQGQLLVLGDPRNGKTSLIKAISGEEFDSEEKQTSGVEFKFVDRKWQTVELPNMKFGDFNTYSEKSVYDVRFFPRIFNECKFESNGSGESLSSFESFLLFLFIFVLPIIFAALGENNGRWLLYFIIMALLLLFACIGEGSLNVLLMLYFQSFATCVAYKFYGCSDKSVLIRFILFLNELVSVDIIPRYFISPFFFFVLEWYLLVLVVPFLIVVPRLWPKFSTTGILLLNFIFKYQEEILQPIGISFFFFIFFAPIGLSCHSSSIIFSLIETTCIFLMHITLLYHQNALLNRWTISVLILEFSIIIPLFLTVINDIIANIILLTLGVGLHVYGNWLEFKDDFKGKSFAQVVLKMDFLLHTVQIKKALIDMKRLKNALNDKFSSLKLKILDFAGDEEYYAYHQIFLNNHALYVIVFNIQEYVNDNFNDIASKVARLRFWLESIHSHVPQETPVFLVGTHRADTQIDTLREVNSLIRRAVWHTPFNEGIVVNKKDGLIFFHVENSKGLSDSGILTLREKIKSFAEDQFKDKIGLEIPLSWIKIQDAIIQYVEQNEGPVCLSVEDFQNYFKHLYIEWNDEMLKYFHKKGFIIHIDKDPGLSNWVLLKPDVLVKVVILLINQPGELANKRGQRSH